jgi:hypothetical protein
MLLVLDLAKAPIRQRASRTPSTKRLMKGCRAHTQPTFTRVIVRPVLEHSYESYPERSTNLHSSVLQAVRSPRLLWTFPLTGKR